MNVQRVILTTGGTGGHVFPALAVADAIRDKFPAAEILFVGGNYGPERVWAEDAGLRFEGLPARGVLGRGWRAAGAAVWLTRSLVRAAMLIGSFKPDAVLGFGGYAGFSAVLAARLRGVPTAIHEQNSVPGMTNRVLAKLVRKVFLSFPLAAGTGDDIPAEKIVFTGNPVRASIGEFFDRDQRASEDADRKFRILILGGSQGAKAVNDAMIGALDTLKNAGVEILHQAGHADAERTLAEYEKRGWNPASVVPFIGDMAGAYAWADLAVCRAGATTVAELAVAGLPSLLVPFPHATHDHQTLNAKYLEDAGAAVLLPQADLTQRPIAGEITALMNDPERLADMATAARNAARAEAAREVVEQLETIAKKA